jgi:hypothetical protein
MEFRPQIRGIMGTTYQSTNNNAKEKRIKADELLSLKFSQTIYFVLIWGWLKLAWNII